MRVSVIGGSTVGEGEEAYRTARAVGRLLGEADHEVVCGGLGGVMAAACEGAAGAGGHTIGILPGEDRSAANEHVAVAVATGLGNARNALVALNGDAAIAVDGATGTLSEIAMALDYGRPVAGVGAHDVGLAGYEAVGSAADAVESVERRAGRG